MYSRTAFRFLIFLLCIAALCGAIGAQAQRTIVIRMIDGKTGKLIEASNYLVRVDRDQTVHANWVTQNEDGTNKLTLPQTATLLAIQGTYDNSMLLYLNCDSAGEKDKTVDHWYEISAILATGLAAPNACLKPRDAAKFKIAAKPGEFIFFVRKKNMLEQAKDDFADRCACGGHLMRGRYLLGG